MSHIYALAGMAGLNYSVKQEYDYGVDGQLNLVTMRKDASKPGGFRRVSTGYALEFQAKASFDWKLRDGHIVYDLEAKNYNDIALRTPAEATLILILLCLPRESGQWHGAEEDATILQSLGIAAIGTRLLVYRRCNR
ncbi:MAG TPA: DUF4365 domain-containing protein [Edaphobacter sp.]|nr:DUF4365 domain-containing protein [Edaphobacter sp.]